jgi:hypothetical protein
MFISITTSKHQKTNIMRNVNKHKHKHISQYTFGKTTEINIFSRREIICFYNERDNIFLKYRVLHRIDGPAIVEFLSNGKIKKTEWFIYGKRHRIKGPAIIYDIAEKYTVNEWFCDGKRHRDNGPAYIKYHNDGHVVLEEWYNYGILHRIEKPAHIRYYNNGNVKKEEWHNNGKIYCINHY